MSMFRLSTWLCHGNVLVLILLWYSMWHYFACIGHWYNNFLQLGQAIWASTQSIFLRCLWFLANYDKLSSFLLNWSMRRHYKEYNDTPHKNNKIWYPVWQVIIVRSVSIKSIIPNAVLLDVILLSVEVPKFGATVIIKLKNVAFFIFT
jgi:hypothetical protein